MTSAFGPEFGPDFTATYTNPISESEVEYPLSGWATEAAAPTFLLCDLSGNPVAELPIVSATLNSPLSRPGDADLTVHTALKPELLGLLTPWTQTIILIADGKPVWGGTVVKRRTELGKTATVVGVREWTAWLDRVWTTATTEYIPGGTLDDAGYVIYHRMVKAHSLATGYDLIPPLPTWNTPTGVEFDGEFVDQSDEPSPQTMLAEIGNVATTAGVDWDIEWIEGADGRFTSNLRTFAFDAQARTTELVVGTDCATATIELDTDVQATRLKVVGADDEVLVGTQMHYPPLMRAVSFDKVELVGPLANSLLSLVQEPVLTVSDVDVPGLRHTLVPGDLVAVVVPAGFDARFPSGVNATMRVSDVTWEESASSRSTKYTMTSLWEAIPNAQARTLGDSRALSETVAPAVNRLTFVETLRQMDKRVRALELRRVPTGGP